MNQEIFSYSNNMSKVPILSLQSITNTKSGKSTLQTTDSLDKIFEKANCSSDEDDDIFMKTSDRGSRRTSIQS